MAPVCDDRFALFGMARESFFLESIDEGSLHMDWGISCLIRKNLPAFAEFLFYRSRGEAKYRCYCVCECLFDLLRLTTLFFKSSNWFKKLVSCTLNL